MSQEEQVSSSVYTSGTVGAGEFKAFSLEGKIPPVPFYQALLSFQQDIGPILRDKAADLWKGRKEHEYASREQVFKQVLESAKKNGFILVQELYHETFGLRVVTEVIHAATGKNKLYNYDFPYTIKGELGPQDSGKMASYASRYALRFALGLTDTDELPEGDDDGQTTQDSVDARNFVDAELNIGVMLREAVDGDAIDLVYKSFKETIENIQKKDKKAFQRIRLMFEKRRDEVNN